ncbi:recombinase family protein [Caballeronia sp. LZ035]|uniref:recombinase family protein n=1 Tax=Caballeronia sp. LZ035 TaxID=3038568 RepID=UPI0028558D5C|nr:recombinase family protein [Caballeronia sp. LZ035]MDR5757659.1 recombinase family protein [Caballeronia sp. LZ035]
MSKGQRVGYIRVSSADQNTARQLDGIELDRIFEDKQSGKTIDRPQLQAMLAYVREGDTLYVHSIDRLARNTKHLLEIVEQLNTRGVTVRFEKNSLIFGASNNDHSAKLMMTMLAAFADFERELIKERQAEGIAIAKADGKYKGRKPSLTDTQAAELRARIAAGEQKAEVARSYGISRATLYTYLS